MKKLKKVTGVIKQNSNYYCVQCESTNPKHFYQYDSSVHSKKLYIAEIVYHWVEWIM